MTITIKGYLRIVFYRIINGKRMNERSFKRMKKTSLITRKLKSILSLALGLILMVTPISTVNGVVTLSQTNANATVLNNLGLLRGDGQSYNLDGQLKRSEGVAFIVRLLGVEKEVLANKIKYANLEFGDVNAQDWFAPYVGYCVEAGIINGYPDGTFKPNDTLSEQAFIKMVLGAMGYRFDIDYTWNIIFSFAYSKGIVTDANYATQVADNLNYTRGNVVNLLHHVLGQKMADGKTLMVEKLVETAAIKPEQAKQFGFIVDSISMVVEELSRVDGDTFFIRFNEPADQFTVDNIMIKEKGREGTLKALSVRTGEVERILYVDIEAQVPDREYTLTLTNVKDKEGNVLADYTMDFLGFRPANYTSNYFRIQRVVGTSGKTIEVYFTQPIDINEIEPANLVLAKDGAPLLNGSPSNMKLSADSSNPYLLHVEFLTYQFTEATYYELHVGSTVKSAYGAFMKEGMADSAKFIPATSQELPFNLDKIVLDSNNSLLLTFNKHLNVTIAEQVFSYYLKSALNLPIKITKAQVLTSGPDAYKMIRLTTEGTLEAKQSYKLMINQLYTSDRSESIIETEKTFVAEVAAKAEVKVLSTTITAKNRIELVLDRYLDPVEALKIANYTIEAVKTPNMKVQPMSVYYHTDSFKPILVLNLGSSQGLTDNETYKITLLSTLITAEGNVFSKNAVGQAVAVPSLYKPEGLSEAIYIGNKIVMISGTRELALDVPNVLNNNYTLSYVEGETIKTMKPLGVTYVSPRVILLRFETFDTNVNYQLTAQSLVTSIGTTIDAKNNPVNVEIEVVQ